MKFCGDDKKYGFSLWNKDCKLCQYETIVGEIIIDNCVLSFLDQFNRGNHWGNVNFITDTYSSTYNRWTASVLLLSAFHHPMIKSAISVITFILYFYSQYLKKEFSVNRFWLLKNVKCKTKFTRFIFFLSLKHTVFLCD